MFRRAPRGALSAHAEYGGDTAARRGTAHRVLRSSTTMVIFKVSSYCHHGGCVAVGGLPDGRIAVRDDKVNDGPLLVFTAAEWDSFVDGVKEGQFDTSVLRSTVGKQMADLPL